MAVLPSELYARPARRDTMRIGWLLPGLLVLFVGLLLIVWPVLDSLPFPGSSREYYFELWVPGIPPHWDCTWSDEDCPRRKA